MPGSDVRLPGAMANAGMDEGEMHTIYDFGFAINDLQLTICDLGHPCIAGVEIFEMMGIEAITNICNPPNGYIDA